jgi:hypothetical protein
MRRKTVKGVVSCEVIKEEPMPINNTTAAEPAIADAYGVGSDVAGKPTTEVSPKKKSRKKKRRGSEGVESAAKRTKDMDHQLNHMVS